MAYSDAPRAEMESPTGGIQPYVVDFWQRYWMLTERPEIPARKRERPGKRSVLASAQQKVLHFDRSAGVSAAKTSNVGSPMLLHMMHYKTG